MTIRIDPLLRALADPTRLRIMRLLAAMELAVGELAQVLGQSQPRVSRHIRILADAGLAERRKEGSWVFLKAAVSESGAPSLGSAAARLLELAEQDDPSFAARCAEDRRHLAAIRAAREATAAAYFARHAGHWDEIRTLHSPDGPVEAALLAAGLKFSEIYPMTDEKAKQAIANERFQTRNRPRRSSTTMEWT